MAKFINLIITTKTMNNKDTVRQKIATSNIPESLKIFLLLSIDTLNDEQINWLTENC